MRTISTQLGLVGTLTALFASVGEAQQTPIDPQIVLTRVDSVLNAPEDQTKDMHLVLIDKAGSERTRTLRMWQKGDDTRSVKFLAPADVRNIGFLSLPDDIMYLYLPAYKKVRRIAAHVKNQSFAGTDFTYDDMGSINYAEDYDARLAEETPEQLVLALTPKEGVDKDYGQLKMWILKDTFHPTRIEYYDRANNLWKVMEMRELTQLEGYWTAMEIEMDDLKVEHRTIMQLSEVTFDSGLSDDLFTQRYLMRRP